MRLPLPALVALVLAAALTPRGARAFESADVDGAPVGVDVTATTGVLYNADNRNSRAGDVARRIDDDWGAYYQRLDTQAKWKNWAAGLRLDSALFYAVPSPTKVALDLLGERHGGALPASYSDDDVAFFLSKTAEASRELSTRYVDWLYPAKYYAAYTTRDVEVTLGDFYAQFGRGLVLSVRKLDELASDTTIRGARVTARARAGALRFRLTGLGGVLNPLRFDEASGRYLGVTSSTTTGLASITEAGMPRAIASPFDAAARPTYAPDRIVGVELEGGTKDVSASLQASALDRALLSQGGVPSALSPGAVRSAREVRTAGFAVNAPDLDGHGAAYAEVAFQNLDYPSSLPRDGSELPEDGYAVYGNLSVSERALTVTAEGKHYRRFFPLLANVDLGRAPEFGALQYSAPPTTEAPWVDTELEGFNTCVSGGRLRADVAVGPRETVFAWAGRYLTWAESVSNETCRTKRKNENDVWDFAAGLELRAASRRSRATATVGSRFDTMDRAVPDPAGGGETRVFYREVSVRHDVLEWLGGPFALKVQGYGRRRRLTLGGPKNPFWEVQELVAVEWDARLTAGIGFEYTGNPEFPPTYVNGVLGYNPSASSNLSLFVGQRRGGLRCVSGICRVYPGFEGVRLDATFRF
jgi:hypothetical protein